MPEGKGEELAASLGKKGALQVHTPSHKTKRSFSSCQSATGQLIHTVRHTQFHQVPNHPETGNMGFFFLGWGGKQPFVKLYDKTEDNILMSLLYNPNTPFTKSKI